MLQRTRLPRSAQQQPQQRLLCPDPDQPAAKRRRLGDESEEVGAVALWVCSGGMGSWWFEPAVGVGGLWWLGVRSLSSARKKFGKL